MSKGGEFAILAAARYPWLLVAGGGRDSTRPSGAMVPAIAERRAEAKLITVSLSYAEAGHGLAGTSWYPMQFALADDTLAANAAAQAQIWAAMTAFLDNQLAKKGGE